MHLVKLLTAEFQKNREIYISIENFYNILDSNYWIKNYIFWELNLFKMLGYDLELENLVNKEMVGNKFRYVTKSTIDKKIVPNFLIDRNYNEENILNLLDGLKLVGDYLDKTILKPNNINYPSSRQNFISSLN